MSTSVEDVRCFAEGLEEAIRGMRMGGQRLATVPSQLAYKVCPFKTLLQALLFYVASRLGYK